MKANNGDVTILRGLARQVADIAAKPVQDERRDLWRRHNSLQATRPLVLVTGVFCWHEMDLEGACLCRDPFLRDLERQFRKTIIQDTWGDDMIVEPWVKVQAAPAVPSGDGRWGPPIQRIPSPHPGGSWMFDPPIKQEADLDKLVAYPHRINEQATAARFRRAQDAIGDILQVCLSRSPVYNGWVADISTDLARLRGLEQVMWDMVDRPAWLHRLCEFMRDAVLAQQDAAEAAGDWRLCNHNNQAMPYSLDLPDPSADPAGVSRKQLWGFFAAQEMAQVSPAMHEEFILRYQMPIMARFGLLAYGCCEDLGNKIGMLRQVPNLRRIAVTPFANVRKCAEQIGRDYVLSWRPSPAEMICNYFKGDHIRRIVRQAMDDAKGCGVDITLKDVQTVRGHFEDFAAWVRIVRDVTDHYA